MQLETNTTHISRHELELLLIATTNSTGKKMVGISSITRLQKLLFFIQEEGFITQNDDGFQFEAYKAGPYSSKLYDDLEFLENIGLIRSEITAEATVYEAVEIDKLSFDYLLGDEDSTDVSKASDHYEERRFILTTDGLNKVQTMLTDPNLSLVVNGIREIESRFANRTLSDLLYYVYTKYPEMAIESEIKSLVLSSRRLQSILVDAPHYAVL